MASPARPDTSGLRALFKKNGRSSRDNAALSRRFFLTWEAKTARFSPTLGPRPSLENARDKILATLAQQVFPAFRRTNLFQQGFYIGKKEEDA